ncbi:MAG: hypothetical protein HUJ99_06005, partial [Bacteroidaceae bacterium]|nr:hypothetical protein [Bacteroidaceae bacterium]
AEGRMDNVTKKHALTLDFFNIAMQAKGGIKETLVSHFAKVVRLKMLRQLQAVGDISFNGRLGVKYKLVDVQGLLHCKQADLRFKFYIDGQEKMLHGEAKSDKINLGEIMNVKALTIGRTTAKFAINTGKNTPKGQYANKHHGRLPIGTLTAEIDEAEYGIVKVKRIIADVTSNGVVAEGTIHAINSLVDADVAFEYKQTDEEQDLKTKKKVRLHKKDKKENSVKKTNKKSTKSK